MKNNKYKILLVEDDGNIRTVIAALLETSDYQVIQAETGAMAETLFTGSGTSGYGWNGIYFFCKKRIADTGYCPFGKNE